MKCSNCGKECSSRHFLPGDTKCLECRTKDHVEGQSQKPKTEMKQQGLPVIVTVLYALPFLWIIAFFIISYITQFNKGPWLWRFFKRGLIMGQTDTTSFTIGLKNLLGLPPSLTWFIDVTNPTPFLVLIILIIVAKLVDINIKNNESQVLKSDLNKEPNKAGDQTATWECPKCKFKNKNDTFKCFDCGYNLL